MARTKKTTTSTTTSLKFEKGAFYEDQQGKIWTCSNGRTRKTPDGHEVVDMRATTLGQASGEAGEEYVDLFVRKLTKAEVAERVAVERREAEALVEAHVAEDEMDGKAKETAKTKTTRKAPVPKAEPHVAEETVETMAEANPGKTKMATTNRKSDGKLSALDAAAKVLAEAGQPMTAKAMIDAMAAKGYWTSPAGQTPQGTLYTVVTMLPKTC